MVLRHAGTLVIDGGRPLPAMVGETVRNLTEISPTIYFNVPAGYAALLPHLERDETFARSFFAKLRLIFYAGAALPQDLWERLEAVSVRTTGPSHADVVLMGHDRDRAARDRRAFPARPRRQCRPARARRRNEAGAERRQARDSRARAEHHARLLEAPRPHARRRSTRKASTSPGDAVRFADESDPRAGVMFDGRLAEDFKLTTGTWVHVGGLRVGVLAACSPVLQDAIVAGADRAFVALLCWLNAAGCQKLIGETARRAPCPISRGTRWCASTCAQSLAQMECRRIRAHRSGSRA